MYWRAFAWWLGCTRCVAVPGDVDTDRPTFMSRPYWPQDKKLSSRMGEACHAVSRV